MKEMGKLAIASSLLFGLVGMVTGISAVCVCASQSGEPRSEAFKQAKKYVEAEEASFNASGYSIKIKYDYQNIIAEAEEFGYYTFLYKEYNETTWVNYGVCGVMSYKNGNWWSVSIRK